MRGLKNVLKTGALGAVVAIGAMAVTTSASAYIACNKWGDCWKVASKPAYPVGLGVTWYGDNWRGYTGGRYHWRAAPAGRGYYDHGRWRRW